mgnify:FL=1
MAGHNVVPAQTGEVLGDDHVDLLGLNIRDHPLEAGRSKLVPLQPSSI